MEQNVEVQESSEGSNDHDDGGSLVDKVAFADKRGVDQGVDDTKEVDDNTGDDVSGGIQGFVVYLTRIIK